MIEVRMIAQERAEFALNEVLKIKEDKITEFRNFSAGVPSMILQNGFGQTIAFFLSRGKDHHLRMVEIIKEWLESRDLIKTTQANEDFVKEIMGLEQKKYLYIQDETLHLLEWVKRFSHAFLPDPNKKEDS